MNWGTGDFAGDGTVDINDLTIVLSHFGQSVSTGSPSTVPEPGSLLLAAAAAAPAWGPSPGGNGRVGQGRPNFWWGRANQSTVVQALSSQQSELPRPQPHQNSRFA